MKTLKGFLNENKDRKEIYNAIWKQGGVNFANFKNDSSSYYAANSGSVPGVIYYSDTVKFGKKHHLEILQILDEFERDCGRLEDKPSPLEEEAYFNWLTWFAWESMAGDLIDYLEEF